MEIVSIAVSARKGTVKTPVAKANVLKNHGIEGDAHVGAWHRQVSFLAKEKIDEARCRGLDVSFGDFGENIATLGVDWKTIPVGARVRLGESALLEITQIGKKCHTKCEIYNRTGDCIMPVEGVFARVLEDGEIHCGDRIAILGPAVDLCSKA